MGAALHAGTIPQLVERMSMRYADRIAVVSGEQRIPYRDVAARSRIAATGLLRAGIRRGDNVAIWMPNRPEWICAFLGAGLIGAVTVGLSTRYRAEEAKYVLAQSHSVALVMVDRSYGMDHSAMLEEIRGGLPRLRTVLRLGGEPDLFARGDDEVVADAGRAVRPEDPLVIIYTSGTTAFPKGAVLSQGSAIRNAAGFGDRMGIDETDRYFNVSPYFHAGGAVGTILMALGRGACILQLEPFEPGAALRFMERERATAHGGVDTLFMKEMEHPDFARVDLGSLKKGSVLGTGEIVRTIHDRMGITGIIPIYGLSEATCNVAAGDQGEPIDQRLRTVGRPLEGMEARVVDPDTGETLPPGTPGEVQLRGWSLMLGYYDKPAETAEAIDADGWLHTGDRGTIDEAGRITYLSRIKDVIRVGGENFAPAEVEELIAQDPRVQRAQVVALPDPVLREVGVAFVQLRAGTECSSEEIAARCRERLAKFKVPRHVLFVDEWPLTASGKVRKAALREIAAARVLATAGTRREERVS